MPDEPAQPCVFCNRPNQRRRLFCCDGCERRYHANIAFAQREERRWVRCLQCFTTFRPTGGRLLLR